MEPLPIRDPSQGYRDVPRDIATVASFEVEFAKSTR
jgi:hypothetical protein